MASLFNKSVLLQRGSTVRFQCFLRGFNPSFSTFGFEKFSGKEKTEESIFIRREEEINKERLLREEINKERCLHEKISASRSIEEEVQSEILLDELRGLLSEYQIFDDGQQFFEEMIILPAPPLKSVPPEAVKVQCFNDISPIEGTSLFHLSAKNDFARVKRKLSYFLLEQDGSEKDLKDRVNQSDMTGSLECEQLVNRYLLCKYCHNILQQLYTISSTQKMGIVGQFIHNANALLRVVKRMKSRAENMIRIIIDNHASESKFLKLSWAFFNKKACHARLRLCFGLQAMRDANSYVFFKEGSRLIRLLGEKVEKRRRGEEPAKIYCRIRQLRKAMAVLKLVVTSKENTIECGYKKRSKEVSMSIVRKAKQIISIWHKICIKNFAQHSAIVISMSHVVRRRWNVYVATIAALKRIRVKRELYMLGNSIFTRKVGLLKGWKVLVAAMVRCKIRGLKKSMAALVRRTTLLKTAFKGLVLNYTEGNILLQKGSLHSTVCMKGRAVTILLHNKDRFRLRREKDALIGGKIAEGKLRRSFQRIMWQLILASRRGTETGRQVETALYATKAMNSDRARSHNNLRCWQKGLICLKGNLREKSWSRQQEENISKRHRLNCLQQTLIRLLIRTKDFICQRKISTKLLTEASFVKKQIYFKRLLRHHFVQLRIKRGRRASLQRFCNLPFQQWIYYARLKSPHLSASPESQILKEGRKVGLNGKEQDRGGKGQESLRRLFKISIQHLNCVEAQRRYQLKRIKLSITCMQVLRVRRKAVKIAVEDIIVNKLAQAFHNFQRFTLRRRELFANLRANLIVRNADMLSKALMNLKYNKRLRFAFRAVCVTSKRRVYALWVKRTNSRYHAKKKIINFMMGFETRKITIYFKEWVINTQVENLLSLAKSRNCRSKKNSSILKWVSITTQNKFKSVMMNRAQSMYLQRLTRSVYKALLLKIERRHNNEKRMRVYYACYMNYLCRHVVNSLLFLRKNRIALRFYLSKSFLCVVKHLRYNRLIKKKVVPAMRKGEKMITKKMLLRWKGRVLGREKTKNVKEKKSWETIAARQSKTNTICMWRSKSVLKQAIKNFFSFTNLSIRSFKASKEVQLYQSNRSLHLVFISLLHLLRSRHLIQRDILRYQQSSHFLSLRKTFHKLDLYCSMRWAKEQRLRIVCMHAKKKTFARAFRKLMDTCCKSRKRTKSVGPDGIQIRSVLLV